MAGSTLNPDNFPVGKGQRGPKGHDTRSLGPSDTSDSGSDMAGPGLLDDDVLGLDRGTNEDSEAGRQNVANAGLSVGNPGMDDNSDSAGTGEHATAGKQPNIRPDADLDTDRIVGASEAGLGGGLDQAEEAQLGITDEELQGDESSDSRPRRAPRPTGRT